MNDFGLQLSLLHARKEVSWVDVDGVPAQEGGDILSVSEILASEDQPDLSLLRLRDPDHFVAGGLHVNVEEWEKILIDHPMRERILKWLRNGVDILEFVQRFRGRFKKENYNSDHPPRRRFGNHSSCRAHASFVSCEILKRVTTGAVIPWGKVTDSDPPYLVLPLTVEPSKPRLCLDARFLNLWMKDSPFHLDKLSDVPRYIYKNSHITKCDDRSGYDHIRLTESSRSYFGFQWEGWWFVCATLPFGWKESPFIYHNVGLAASGYFRSLGIPCSLYIDDRLNGELLTSSGPWSKPPSQRSESFSFNAAKAAIFIVLSTLVKLGYTIGISKSCLNPVQYLVYLGFIVDSQKQAFILPKEKISAFACLRETILDQGSFVDIKTLQRLQGKCISFSLAVPGAKLFIRSMSSAIGAAPPSGRISLSPTLREEIAHWRFLDSWSDVLPWRDEKHVLLSMSTDASGYGWGGILHHSSGDQSLRDYWTDEEMSLTIVVKELLALFKALQSAPAEICNCRVDIQVDSKTVIDTIEGQGSKSSPQLTTYIKDLFFLLCERNLQISLSHVCSAANPADDPSRILSPLDSTLSPKAWHLVEEWFGGVTGHSFDLMALDSNAALDRAGNPLPHFTPWPSPNSWGVNIFAQDLSEKRLPMTNPFVFPPFNLVGPVVKFLCSFGISFTIVVPEFHPQPYWWPGLLNISMHKMCLGSRGDMDVILSPSKSGFKPVPCPVKLWACRVSSY